MRASNLGCEEVVLHLEESNGSTGRRMRAYKGALAMETRGYARENQYQICSSCFCFVGLEQYCQGALKAEDTSDGRRRVDVTSCSSLRIPWFVTYMMYNLRRGEVERCMVMVL